VFTLIVTVPSVPDSALAACPGRLFRAARQLTGNVVDAVVDDDVHLLVVLVLGDLGLGELLGHGGGGWVACGRK
jgi:hypothetical protein